VHGSVESSACRDFESEPALARSSGAGDRGETHARRRKGRLDMSECVGPSDEAMVQSRKARRGEGVERREVLAQAGCDELEDLSGGGDVLQPVVSEGAERAIRKRLGTAHVPRRARDDDLLAVRRGAYPGSDDDVHAHVPLGSELGLPRVNADPKTVSRLVGPRLLGQRTLDLGCRRNRVASTRKREEHAVARPVDLGPVVVRRSLAYELPHASASGCEALAQQMEETRRPLDVGEEKRHRA